MRESAIWSGNFTPMVPLTQLEVGYYGELTTRNIAKGLFSWGGDGRACGEKTGWFTVDDVAYAAGALTAIDIRFEQRCIGATGVLHGKPHWRSDNP